MVVVMHGYGGLVSSEAISNDFSYTERQPLNLTGGVIHLIYINGYILNEGQSVLSAFGKSPYVDIHVSLSEALSLVIVVGNTDRIHTAQWTLLSQGRRA